MSPLTRLRRDERGLSVVEFAVASLISLLALGLIGGVLHTGLKTSQFASNQSTSLDGARQVLIQVARDLQGSQAFSMPETVPGVKGTCVADASAGSCVLLVVTTPPGPDRVVRLRLDGTDLYREIDDGTGTFPASELMSDRVANLVVSPPEPLFECATTGTLLQVRIHLLIQPDPATSPHFQLDTLVRPRNTYQPAGC